MALAVAVRQGDELESDSIIALVDMSEWGSGDNRLKEKGAGRTRLDVEGSAHCDEGSAHCGCWEAMQLKQWLCHIPC